MITVKFDTKPVLRMLDDLQRRQIPYATSRALNATARAVQKGLEAEVTKVFDRPVPFTRRAFAVQFSNKQNLTAAVFIKPAQQKYLMHQIEGGRRPRKRFEERLTGETKTGTAYFVPGAGARLTAAGNMSRQQIVAITNKLRAKGQDVFAGTVRGRFGIWQRTRRNGLKPLLVEIPEPRYTKRLPFYETGLRVVEREWSRQFAIAFEQAMRTAR